MADDNGAAVLVEGPPCGRRVVHEGHEAFGAVEDPVTRTVAIGEYWCPGRTEAAVPVVEGRGLCRRQVPHDEHDEVVGLRGYRCWGRPDPASPAGQAWEVIYGRVLDALHGDASGLDEGVAAAVAALGYSRER